MKKHRIWIFIAAVAVSLFTAQAAENDDFGLMKSTETTIKLMRELSQNYVDEVEAKDLLRDAAYGMTRMLDPYSTYLAEEDMDEFRVMTTGKYGGIGSVIRQKGKYVVVAQPYKNSPAAKAGLKIGDRFITIDGKDAVGMTTAEASENLKGTPGTKLKVVVCPIEDTTTTRKITITRERIQIPSISYSGFVGQPSDMIGYIRHADFTEGCYDDMSKVLTNMKNQGLKGVVLDYRGNGGGILQEAVDILSLFVPKGTEVVTIKGRADSTTYKTTRSPMFEDLPLVVLIDETSASASEIVAGALQDLDRAVLVGQRSFGKGLVQSTIHVGYNSYLKLTTARYYIPSGRCIQAIDYSQQGANSSSSTKTADSLKREFMTRSGRKVFDGGGVAPDVETEPEYVSRFAAMLYGMGIIDEFGDEYYIRNKEAQIDTKSFSISDAEYSEFVKFVEAKDIPYKSRTRTLLEEIKKVAKEERYNDSEEQLALIEEALKDDKLTNLETYRTEITKYINHDIIVRYGFYDAVIEHSLTDDTEVNKAIEILTTPDEWQRSLEAHEERTKEKKE
ncbi:MAG: S41 family peptidase [Rikenellaceae bacterium]